MSRYRLYPTPEQETALIGYCGQARATWNAALELYEFPQKETYGEAVRKRRKDGTEYIHQKRRPTRPVPSFNEQCRMLTEARSEIPWLKECSSIVQQQALRDFNQAINNFFKGTHGFPQKRKKYRRDGFRITGDIKIQKLNRHWSHVFIPKLGWVRLKVSRPVPDARSFRITKDRSGRWHIALAVKPEPIPSPENGATVGIDRGVVITAALSDGRRFNAPRLSKREQAKRLKHERRASRAPKGSARRNHEYQIVNRLRAKETDRRKDWAEKLSTRLARDYDFITFEDLRIKNMTRSAKGTAENPGRNVAQKRGLNRAILSQGWGLLARRTEEKAPGRVTRINPRNTSLKCSECHWIAKDNRKSQAVFRCVNCGFKCNADENASINTDHDGINVRGLAAGQAGNSPPIPEGMCREDTGPSIREPLAVAS